MWLCSRGSCVHAQNSFYSSFFMFIFSLLWLQIGAEVIEKWKLFSWYYLPYRKWLYETNHYRYIIIYIFANIHRIILGVNETYLSQVVETTLCYLYILNCPVKTKGGYLNLCLMVPRKYVHINFFHVRNGICNWYLCFIYMIICEIVVMFLFLSSSIILFLIDFRLFLPQTLLNHQSPSMMLCLSLTPAKLRWSFSHPITIWPIMLQFGHHAPTWNKERVEQGEFEQEYASIYAVEWVLTDWTGIWIYNRKFCVITVLL